MMIEALFAGALGVVIGIQAALNLARIRVMRRVLGIKGPYPSQPGAQPWKWDHDAVER